MSADLLRFGTFQLDPATGELQKDGRPVRLPPQPARVLDVLASNAGRLVTRDELRDRIWRGDTFVDFEQGLNFCIKQIRAALGDDAKAPKYIETLPRRGYRFLASVERGSPAAAATDVRLAVLPFENLSGDPEQEYFSDGLTEEMIAHLGRVNPQQLRVIGRTSAMQYKRTTKSLDVVGRELDVTSLLEGSVRRSGTRVRVTARLVDVGQQSTIWSESYDRDIGDILALQSDLARAIADAVRVQLTPRQSRRLAGARPVDPAAYEQYLLGRYCWNRRDRPSLERAVRHFEAAIDRQPELAAAYAGLADTYLTQLDFSHLAPLDAFNLAGGAVSEALRLDPSLAEAYSSLGHLRFHEFDWRASDAAFEQAIQIDPAYGASHLYRSNLLAALGRFEDARREARIAVQIDPVAANARQNLMSVLYHEGRFEEAIEQGLEVLSIDANLPNVQYYLGLSLERLGRYKESLAMLERIPRPGSRGATVSAAIAYARARSGDRSEAEKHLDRLRALADTQYVSPYDVALLHVVLGQREAALARLWQAFEQHSSHIPFVRVDTRLDEIRSEPRFSELIDALKFPDAVRVTS